MLPPSQVSDVVSQALAQPPQAQAQEIQHWIARSEQWVDHQGINLYAATNIQSPTMRAAMHTTLDARPSLGDPGDKYETGLAWADCIEVLANQVMRRLFSAAYAELRVASGSLANLYGYMATCKPGDVIYALPKSVASHATHHRQGAAGLYHLTTHDIPLRADGSTIDLDQLEVCCQRDHPALVILGTSLVLTPYPVAEVVSIAHKAGARVMFDAAHISGLIAGYAFPNPLDEGADILTMSTYKSFGGPAGGAIFTNNSDLYQSLRKIAYPGLTSNFDLARLSGLAVAALELQEYGTSYASQCIANAQALAQALAERGVPVWKPISSYTSTHLIAIDARPFGGGTHAARCAEPANIFFSGIALPLPYDCSDHVGIRLGTQEITRWGLQTQDMGWLANILAEVLEHPEQAQTLRQEVIDARKQWQTLKFVFPTPDPV